MAAAIRHVKLELLRPGLAHNQLLSPLTPYIALCGAAGPVTINLPFEHRQLLSRLERLRYSTASDEVPVEQRQFEVRDMGEVLGRVLAQIPSLAPELGRARTEDQGLVHLRLSVSALELALVPFELAIAAEGFPGSGSPLFVQSRAPISLTREVRRGQPIPVEWNRKPRILFAFAQPDGVSPVPAAEHLAALRRAIDPWVKWEREAKDRLQHVKGLLTVLPNASLKAIRDECLRHAYTHVHILAHGAPMSAGELRFGLMLSDPNDAKLPNVIDGETLGLALTGRESAAADSHRPTLVTLATCDSGQVGSTLAPGGSIAHELNATGIPWVIASQFPLWMRASTIAIEALYTDLLRGEDPRWVLYQVRQRLRTDVRETHDWASIVAYATVPATIDRDVAEFRNRQVRRELDVLFDRVERLARALEDARKALEAEPPLAGEARTALEKQMRTDRPDLDQLCTTIRGRLAQWNDEVGAEGPAPERAERLGMWAAGEKRIGILLHRLEKDPVEGRRAYQKSRDLYQRALEAEPVNHWVITQFLSMVAVLARNAAERAKLADEYGFVWLAARQIAQWDLKRVNGTKAAWALGTLAELEMLGCVFGGKAHRKREALIDLRNHCERLVEAAGDDTFPVFSTRRQFKRYLEDWQQEAWAELAKAAVDALKPSAPV